MLSISPTSSAPAAFAFVAGLATIGIMSHLSAENLSTDGSVITGSLQSTYEQEFTAANPLSELAVTALGALKYAVFGQASPGAIIGDDGWIFTSEELKTNAGFSDAIISSVAEIAFVKSVLEGRGTYLLPVIVPDKSEVYREKLGFVRAEPVRERLSTFKNLLSEAGVNALDASMPLCQEKAAGDVFMRDDTHWSPIGAQAVAGAIADELSDFDFARSDVETRMTGATAFDGDLLSYVPTGLFRPMFGPKQGGLEQYETNVATTGGLFGESAIDIVLVGTSFSAKPEWHFEGFLKQALSADVLNVATEGQGPFAPMDAFLRDGIWDAHSPKIVIWEIPVRYISKERNQ
ncbi:MAG: alginate O-acetyltransferase AlgX-related protein [Nereida ignava]